jgi:hypothetical protein
LAAGRGVRALFFPSGGTPSPVRRSLGKDLDALKHELETDAHRILIDELCQRFGTDLERGLTAEAAAEGREMYGPNSLTPPPTTPGRPGSTPNSGGWAHKSATSCPQSGSRSFETCSEVFPCCSGSALFFASSLTPFR